MRRYGLIGCCAMAETLTIPLFNRQQAWAVIRDQVYPYLGGALQAGKRLVITIAPEKRSSPQNRRYWGQGVLAQIAQQAAPNGKLYSAEVWHELAKRKFIGVDELPDGSVIGKSSTQLTTAEFSDFCTQVEAWACSELGVVFYDLEPRA